jgi:hypothetical protein
MRSQRNRNMMATLLVALGIAMFGNPVAYAQEKKPNIVVIMGDDIGIWNISAYHRGMMGGRTPNIDRIAEFAKLAGACGTLCVHDCLSFLPTAGHEA